MGFQWKRRHYDKIDKCDYFRKVLQEKDWLHEDLVAEVGTVVADLKGLMSKSREGSFTDENEHTDASCRICGRNYHFEGSTRCPRCFGQSMELCRICEEPYQDHGESTRCQRCRAADGPRHESCRVCRQDYVFTGSTRCPVCRDRCLELCRTCEEPYEDTGASTRCPRCRGAHFERCRVCSSYYEFTGSTRCSRCRDQSMEPCRTCERPFQSNGESTRCTRCRSA